MILYRSVGLQELELVYDSGMKTFPARLPQQPIFYPVLQLEYARQIASDWNIKNGQFAGYVTEFKMEDQYVSKFKKHKVGGSQHQELWIPTEEVEEFSRHIVGHIKVLEAYFGIAFEGFVPDKFGLQGKNAVEQFTLLANSYLYKRMDFYLEIKRNHKAVFLNFPFWQTYKFKNPGLKEKIIQAIKEAWLSSFPKTPLPPPTPIHEETSPPKRTPARQSIDSIQEKPPPAERARLKVQPLVDPVYEDITLVEQTDSDDMTDPVQADPPPVRQKRTQQLITRVQEDTTPAEQADSYAHSLVKPVYEEITPVQQTHANAQHLTNRDEEDTTSFKELDSDSWADSGDEVKMPVKNGTPISVPPVRQEVPAIEETNSDSLADLVEEDSLSLEEIDSDDLDDFIEEETESDSFDDLVGGKMTSAEQSISPPLMRPISQESTFPRQAASHFVQGIKLGLSEKYVEAIEELTRAIDEDPDQVIAHTSLGVAFHRLGEDDRALACYETALQIDPNDAEAYYFRANILYNYGNVREAITGYTIAIGLAPELIEAHEKPAPQDRLTDYIPSPAGSYGITRLAHRILELNKLLETNPGQAYLFKERAAAYYRLWNYEQAIADYSSSLALQPEDARALHSRGLAYEQVGKSKRALEDYQRAIAINPQLSDVYLHRGVTLGKMGNFRQSIISLTEGIRLSPRNPIGYFNRGVSYFQQGDFASAIEDFSNVIRLSPNDEAAHHWRGIANEEAGRQREAIADYRRFLELSQDPNARKEIEQRLSQWNEGKRIGLSSRGSVREDRQKTSQVPAEEPGQNLDLYALIAALGERALNSTWFGSGVECYGEKAEQLYAFIDHNKPIQGRELLHIASGISRTIHGDFTGFDPETTTHWILIRAWEGGGFYIELNDPKRRERLKTRFPSVESVEGASAPYEGLFIRT